MDDCLFCKIVSGAIPSHKIYEDDDFIAFLDIHPQSPGHAQVVPKQHQRYVWDVPQVGAYFEVARRVALAQRATFGTEWILSKIVGDEVPHAHIWVFPSSEAQGDKNAFAENAAALRTLLSAEH